MEKNLRLILTFLLFNVIFIYINKAQHVVGIYIASSNLYCKDKVGESFDYSMFTGIGAKISYQYKYKRLGLESNILYSNLSGKPTYNSEYTSMQPYIDNYNIKPLELYGLTANIVYYIKPQVLYFKVGGVITYNSYFQGEYYSRFVNSTIPNNTTYKKEFIFSNNTLASGLSVGTGLLIELSDNVYLNCGLDYYFMNMKPDVTRKVNDTDIYKINPRINFANLNIYLGLSYQFNKKQIRK